MNQFLKRMLALSIVLTVTPIHAEIVSEILEFGYYASKGEMKRERNFSTATGYVRTGGEVSLVEKTNEIPMQLGRLFGFKYRISGFPKDQVSVELKLVVNHPDIERPNGTKVSGYSYPVTMDVIGGSVTSQSGYKFDKAYEMVPGEWRFQYWLGDKLVIDQGFKVIEQSIAQDAALTGTVNATSNPAMNPVGIDSVSEPAQKNSPGAKSVAEQNQLSKGAVPVSPENSPDSTPTGKIKKEPSQETAAPR